MCPPCSLVLFGKIESMAEHDDNKHQPMIKGCFTIKDKAPAD
jgi:hypothetical protein